MSRSPVLAVALLLTAAPGAAAQLPGILSPGSHLLNRWYPKLFWTPSEGFHAGGFFAIEAPMTYATYDDPQPYVAAVTLDGQAATSGSRSLSLDAFAPALADGWRFRLTVAAERRNRENYFGLGNDTEIDDSLDARDHFYHARRARQYARGEIQRRIIGGLRVLLGAHAERWSTDTLVTDSRLAADLGTVVEPGVWTGDRAARVGLVYDTRDHESAPRRGVLVEAIHGVGESGGEAYSRTTGSVRGYLTVAERFTFATRVAGQRMGGDPGIGSLYLFEASDRPFEALGSSRSHRALPDRRFLGEHVLLGNLDLQYTAYEVPTLIRAVVVAYVDVGRVFHNEAFRLTTDDLHVGGGLGLLLHVSRNGVLGLSGGRGPDGVVVQSHFSWPY